MAKFLPQKKKLIEEVFQKASDNTTERSFSGILKSLENTLLEDYKISLSYNTFKTYYTHLVEKDEDYNIKPMILDDLSIYLGYNNFREYCAEWKTVEYSVHESVSKVVINVINKPLLRMPEFVTRQSGIGALGVLVVGGLFLGKSYWHEESEIAEVSGASPAVELLDSRASVAKPYAIQEKHSGEPKIIAVVDRQVGKPLEKQEYYMYWNGERFIATAEADLGAEFRVLPMDERQIRFFKKITKPDTITRSSIRKIWYSKKNNVVEFFTADGRNPENDAELHQLSEHIFKKYIADQN